MCVGVGVGVGVGVCVCVCACVRACVRACGWVEEKNGRVLEIVMDFFICGDIHILFYKAVPSTCKYQLDTPVCFVLLHKCVKAGRRG